MNIKLLSVSVFLVFSFLFSNHIIAQTQAPAEWAVCAACHTIGEGNKVGPDLKGVNDKYSEDWLISFIRSSQTMVNNGDEAAVKIFNEFNKIPMPDNNYSDEQIKGILNYIANYEKPAETKEIIETVPAGLENDQQITDTLDPVQPETRYGPGNNRIIFIVFVILFIVFLIDLLFTEIIKWKWISLTIVFTSLWFIGEIVYAEAKALGRQHGYSPDQPVWFSHKVHAGQNQIDCFYCHSGAMESKHAGIPGTDVCLNCHNQVREGSQTGKTEIQKIYDSKETGKPIEWIQVHNLPDHVYFNHAQHVMAGKRDCTECHGDVENMDRIVQVEDLSMGWCLDCHRTTNVDFLNNDFYKSYEAYHEELKNGDRFHVTVEDIGGTDCSACHY